MTFLVGGIEMKLPIMLGAGVAKYAPQLVPYQRADVSIGAALFGSLMPEPRTGNQEQPFFWPEDWTTFNRSKFGLNSFGMPGDGIDASLGALGSIDLMYPCIVSLAAFSVEGYIDLLLKAEACKQVSGSEANLGCGNVGHLPHAYDLEFIQQLLGRIKALRNSGKLTKPIWFKLSPYLTSDELAVIANSHPEIDFSQAPTVKPEFFGSMLGTIMNHGCVNALVFSNTLANCRFLDSNGRPVTGPFEGRAGLSGPILHAISVNLISWARVVVANSLSLIHAGGNLTGDNVCKSLTVADAVQCVSGPFWYGDGPRFFTDLIAGSELLQEYLSAED